MQRLACGRAHGRAAVVHGSGQVGDVLDGALAHAIQRPGRRVPHFPLAILRPRGERARTMGHNGPQAVRLVSLVSERGEESAGVSAGRRPKGAQACGGCQPHVLLRVLKRARQRARVGNGVLTDGGQRPGSLQPAPGSVQPGGVLGHVWGTAHRGSERRWVHGASEIPRLLRHDCGGLEAAKRVGQSTSLLFRALARLGRARGHAVHGEAISKHRRLGHCLRHATALWWSRELGAGHGRHCRGSRAGVRGDPHTTHHERDGCAAS
mmetsp:Transcript_95397/g.307887  ORF Transcript_95397/g.307887 Transcript_95397/m.307887 type:complete len:265 (+) Transcript_95397:237-1031(+)